MFKEYLHIERFGNEAVQDIELGRVFVFPKLDGTNASCWWDNRYDYDTVRAGSRTREISQEKENQGFWTWVYKETPKESNLWSFLSKNRTFRLYGEWLVPHSFKGYREEAWRHFYVFDVYNDDTEQYLSYEVYQPLLEEFGVEYIPPLAIIKNGSYEGFLKVLEANHYLIPDGGPAGEGIVLKNYDFENKFGRQCFAKIVRNEFKELHHKAMGPPEINTGLMNEERIVNGTVTLALVEKTIAKCIYSRIETGQFTASWTGAMIPELLNRVFYDIIKEELWDQWKAINFATINGKTLKALTIQKIKQLKPEIF